jgi:predicted nucleotide-binding protein
MQRGIERLTDRLRELGQFDLGIVASRDNPPELVGLETSIERTIAGTFGENTPDYERYKGAAQLRATFMAWSDNYPAVQHYREQITGHIETSKQLLQEAIRALKDQIADQKEELAAAVLPATQSLPRNEVFVVHGHDEAMLQAVARFLEQLELHAIILREQPDKGLTIEDCANQVGFAVVLLTPDDIAGTAAAPAARTRQNVIFELGYFAGKLGRGRACLLRKGEVEIPSDLHGVIYKDFDAAGGWKLELVKELKAARLEFDANKVWA